MHTHGWPDQTDFYLLNLIQPLIPILAHHLIALVTLYLCMYLSECKTVPGATVGICCPSGSHQNEMMDDHPQVVLARGSEKPCWWFI